MDLSEAVQAIESTLGIDCFQEGDRWGARESLFPLVEDWVRSRDFDEVCAKLDGHHVLWGPYQTFTELVANDKRCSVANPMFEEVDHPGIGKYLTPGLPIEFSQAQRVPAGLTPRLGEHTEEVLSELLGLDQLSIEALRKKGLVGS
jgi:2-methylfumaryl-CoA isomerase